MFDFDNSFSFSHPRAMALSPAAMIATSHPLAAQAGMDMLRRGGNAVDAAVAAAAALTVVEPMSTGLGGDAFALFYLASDQKIRGLNASGRSPLALSLDSLKSRRLQSIPQDSGLSVTVPGMIDGWAVSLKQYGKLRWDQVLSPAIDYAEKGFLVTPIVAKHWHKQTTKLLRNRESTRVFLDKGVAPGAGMRFCNPDLGRTLRLVAEKGPEEFYTGTLAERIVEAIKAHDGVMSLEDLREHRSDWVSPLAARYREIEVWELPPNTQGLVVLLALKLMEKEPLSSRQHNSGEYLHFLVEAMKLAFADAANCVADPDHCHVPVQELLSSEYIEQRYRNIDPNQAQCMEPGRLNATSDTIYVAVVDAEGNAVSFINSLYKHFGSGITVPGTGVLLQNRGIGFTFQPDHPNCLAPRKRCYHTLVPSMITRDGKLGGVLGVVGAYMQPQAQTQIIANLIDFKMNPQTALDAPRFRFIQGLEISLEEGISQQARSDLLQKGHAIYPGTFPDGYGGGQVILVSEEGLCGGSDFRKDGCALGY